MNKPLRIWLDDQRLPLPGYNVWFKTRDGVDKLPEFVKANAESIEVISFDNTLDCHVEGHQLLNTIETMVCADGLRLPMLQSLQVHTGDMNMVDPMLYACEHIVKANGTGEFWRNDYDMELSWMRFEGGETYSTWRLTEFQGEVF